MAPVETEYYDLVCSVYFKTIVFTETLFSWVFQSMQMKLL